LSDLNDLPPNLPMMARKPLNAALFSATQSAEDKYVPFVEAQLGVDVQVSIPHKFPRDVTFAGKTLVELAPMRLSLFQYQPQCEFFGFIRPSTPEP